MDVGELGRKGGGEIVAAAFDQDDVESGRRISRSSHGGQVHAGVVADRRVRTAAGLDAEDAVGGQRACWRTRNSASSRV